MELCRQSLRQFAKKKRQRSFEGLTERDVFKVLRETCLGLKGLHDKDIVHLDIKPENILQGASGAFKLGDLGMARLISQLKRKGAEIPEGDQRYLAKELLCQN